MSKYITKKNLYILTPFILVALAFLSGSSYKSNEVELKSDIVSENGVNLYAHLSIKIKGENIKIPAGIGFLAPFGSNGMPVVLHTHSGKGIIAAEMEGVVTRNQLMLKNFFHSWGKDFSEDSIFGNKAGEEGEMKMFINGLPNYDFENYVITGKGRYNAGSFGYIDDIEIIYE
ncbi:MAG TPA: hypothetical protein VJ103_00245 [Candidatus Paceibacterota bacterium]|nr:hypothetical protein [Candidatus Paceibacterota bacterium]